MKIKSNNINKSKIASWIFDNIVTLFFVIFTIFGLLVSRGVTGTFLINELSSRVFRNAFMVLSLIIPVIAGLGLNFGIVLGAMAGQAAIIAVRYFNIGGFLGLAVCILISFPLAVLLGYLTGRLYNRTRGQEMIASLIVGFFADGIYQFIFLFAIGVLIKVPTTNALINPSAIGVRTTIDMGKISEGGIGYVIDNIYKIPLMWAMLIFSVAAIGLLTFKYFKNKKSQIGKQNVKAKFIMNVITCIVIIVISIYQIVTDSSLMMVKVPVVTGILIILLCIFIEWIMKTKLGQDFKSVGYSQNISAVSGIDVDKKRIQAVIISTVLAAWGQIIYLQNMGTLNTYGSHTQTGVFAVASLLVGGASLSNASYKHALVGTILFNSMFIISPEIGKALFGQVLLGEYFRTFMVYGVIGLSLGLYTWKNNKKLGRIL